MSFLRRSVFTIAIGTSCIVGCEWSNRNRQWLKKKWAKSGKMVLYGIIATNACIFGAWRTGWNPRLLRRYFTLIPKGPPSQLIGSTFSHQGGIHLSCNMWVLLSILPLAEAMGGPAFASFYLGSALASSLGSVGYKIITRSPVRSVGASGPVLAALALELSLVPDARVVPIFFPYESASCSGQTAMIGGMAVSLAGMVFPRFLPRIDHAAHLSGLACGYLASKVVIKKPSSKPYPSP